MQLSLRKNLSLVYTCYRNTGRIRTNRLTCWLLLCRWRCRREERERRQRSAAACLRPWEAVFSHGVGVGGEMFFLAAVVCNYFSRGPFLIKQQKKKICKYILIKKNKKKQAAPRDCRYFQTTTLFFPWEKKKSLPWAPLCCSYSLMPLLLLFLLFWDGGGGLPLKWSRMFWDRLWLLEVGVGLDKGVGIRLRGAPILNWNPSQDHPRLPRLPLSFLTPPAPQPSTN